ncbi:thiopeptide-type bacteriocin biosynthesis protein [Streptomyces albus]
MPAAVRLGECHDDGGTDLVDVEDIAVTADAHRLYLISISRRRPLEFVTMNAVEPTRRTHPLVRFLTEAPHALSVPCTTFDWGVASGLPFLPALRYGRTILSPARWRLAAADLADPAADWARCDRSLCAWRDQTGVPSVVYLGDGDQRLRLDLEESSHRALLHTHMRRHDSAVLRAESAADAGWIGGHPHEVVIPLATTRSPAKKPYWLNGAPVAGREHGRLPGCDGRFFIKLYARRDRHIGILTRHLPDLLHQLAGEVRWWFLPYRDPDDHLRLRLTVPDGQAAEAAAAIGAWTQRARRAGLLARVQWDTDFPETARFGGRRAWEAAEVYFAADSETAVAQLACCTATGGPDGRALTAASMLDVAIGLIGDAGEAMRWLIGHSQTTGTAPDRGLYEQAITLANPHDHTGLASQPGGEEVIACWTRRRHALTAYRAALTTAEAGTTDVVLPELLHLHHTRMAALDMEAERRCVHLARAAALRVDRPRRGTSVVRPIPQALALADVLAEELSDPRTAWNAAPPGGRAWPQSLAGGAAGISLLHIERAHCGRGEWETVHTWLASAADGDLTAATNASLYMGAPALAFAMNSAAGDSGRYQGALKKLDAATLTVTRRRLARAHARIDSGEAPAMKEFDVIRGLAGRARRLPPQTPPRPPGHRRGPRLPGTSDRTPTPRARTPCTPGVVDQRGAQRRSKPRLSRGHGNFGMAHGIGSVLALLSLSLLHGPAVPGTREAIERICAWTDQWRQHDATGPWWPGFITLDQARRQHVDPALRPRPSWCYGIAGTARAQQLAGMALGDTARQHTAEHAMLTTLQARPSSTCSARPGSATEPPACSRPPGAWPPTRPPAHSPPNCPA